jgi:hypothetical protein
VSNKKREKARPTCASSRPLRSLALASRRLKRGPLGGRPPQENANDETHVACVLAGQPDAVGLRACVRADVNTRAQRDTLAHRYRRANKHRHAPTSTPTATPTATPTPIPTIQVGNLSLPDPRVTNPELFDLRNPNAPIPQFVNAMKMAGIEITAEQVASGMRFQTLKDINGELFVVGVIDLDPNPQKQGETLEGPIPLLIADRADQGLWNWSSITLRSLADRAGVQVGVLLISDYDSNAKSQSYQPRAGR